jgi:hypothetical protein
MHCGRRQGMQALQRPCREVQVAVTKTIEFDVEVHMGNGREASPSNAVDEDIDDYYPVLTEEQHQIQKLEVRMKHDLEI